MTELTPTKLIAVVVPEDAYGIDLYNLRFKIRVGYHYGKEYESQDLGSSRKNKFTIIGTITKASVFDFDAGKYVDYRKDRERHKDYQWYNKGIHNSEEALSQWWIKTPQESFLSLLESNGVYLNNPMGKTEPGKISDEEDDDFGIVSATRDHKIGKWQSYESKTVPQGSKILIIEKL